MITNLHAALLRHRNEVDEIWVAVALINDKGFQEFTEIFAPPIKVHFLIGIDLPTPPSVLRTMKDMLTTEFQARIYCDSKTFHPKVYLIRMSNSFKAFIGSANLTIGGLTDNIEICVEVDAIDICENILSWFRSLYKQGYPITSHNITEYEDYFQSISKVLSKPYEGIGRLRLTNHPLALNELLDSTDFSNSFFKYEHFWAFRKAAALSWEKEADQERQAVYKRLMGLHEIIYPLFKKYGLIDIYEHYRYENIVSSYSHSEGYTQDELDSMWLHYSKSKREIREYENLVYGGDYAKKKERNEMSFANHIRLQVIIGPREVGIWLYIGKSNNGSPFDRQEIQRIIKNKEQAITLFDLLSGLRQGYYIKIGKEKRILTQIENVEMLTNFIMTDSIHVSSYIGFDYPVGSVELSDAEFPTIVLSEFQKLYPIYQLLRDKQFLTIEQE